MSEETDQTNKLETFEKEKELGDASAEGKAKGNTSVDGSTSAGRLGSVGLGSCEAGSATESLEDTFDSSASKEYTHCAE